MHKIMSRAGLSLAVFILAVSLPAQEAGKVSIPEQVKNSLDGLQKTRTANGVFQIKYQNAYFWALEKSVYVNVMFTAGLDNDAEGLRAQIKKTYDERIAAEAKQVEEANKKIKKEADRKKYEPPALAYPEYFHDLYMRVLKGGQVIQEYRSHMPYDGEATANYSFGTILEPGDYEVLLDINRTDNTLDGTQLFPLQVPALRFIDITTPQAELKISAPVFYSEVKQLLQPEARFTVVKNKYEIGPARQDFYPWGDRPFRAKDIPTLAFFVLGAAMTQGNEPWNIAASLEIRRGKETAAKFEALKLTNPYFFQPIEFVKRGKDASTPLPAGEYVLAIQLTDKNQGDKAKGTFEIPIKIIE